MRPNPVPGGVNPVLWRMKFPADPKAVALGDPEPFHVAKEGVEPRNTSDEAVAAVVCGQCRTWIPTRLWHLPCPGWNTNRGKYLCHYEVYEQLSPELVCRPGHGLRWDRYVSPGRLRAVAGGVVVEARRRTGTNPCENGT